MYSIVVPQTRDLLLAARLVLREVLADQAELERELRPHQPERLPRELPAPGPADPAHWTASPSRPRRRPTAARERRYQPDPVLAGSAQVRHVDCGSCNGCEVEVGAVFGPVYDAERYGARLVASPRHADVLLVTGVVTRNMLEPLRRTVEATPRPRVVVAVGDCAMTGGVFADGYGVVGVGRRRGAGRPRRSRDAPRSPTRSWPRCAG